MIILPDSFTTGEKHDDEKQSEIPVTDIVIISRVTTSEAINLQKVGRSVRNYENGTVDFMNRRYKCLIFFSEDEALKFINSNPKYEILTADSLCVNVIPSDYDGVEIEFIPYEFKKYPIEPIEITGEKIGEKHKKVTKPSENKSGVSWITEEKKLKHWK